MKTVLKTVAIGAACAAFMGSPLAQKIERIDFGKREFDANCASCHGISGKGNGPLAAVLTTRPTDLTQLAKRNDGVLPMARLYEVIDGANVPLHGTREMPVWGRDYKVEAANYYFEVPYDPEAYVRTRILALLEYISRLQAK
ncbi:c-type cytochrome [Caldimonas aquatica]|uniref:C-type cytochrome n=1 Tax=Caldimonas aquatica TaxID=376175 RepID=A0ABY6MQ54_9BURK|nr:c-type cytochrome [Schlegelella aquatica]UZD53613.1 c-type cytochrome [Schlegelella aquatica]